LIKGDESDFAGMWRGRDMKFEKGWEEKEEFR
jgi:hypothetical protein